ncbi:MAG: Translation machinery-associated protein 22 [Cyphobasidiales sp. Tagirdzhanova-0007]|nr:MAG: Translation machinery-associated protein 22 [Cyphobasidiales sp. Tagirdzhanova-0007]
MGYAVCTFPPEYCSYGSRLSKCKTWLAKAYPALYSQYYGESTTTIESVKDGGGGGGEGEGGTSAEMDTALTHKMDGLTVDEAKDAAKKEAKAERKLAKEAERISNSKVVIRRIERTKRKMTTSVHGLETFSVDLKKASKLFANKFATGASVSKNAAGEDEIVIQGDVAFEVEEMLMKKTGKEGELFGGRVPEDNVDIIDVKKKKSSAEEQ